MKAYLYTTFTHLCFSIKKGLNIIKTKGKSLKINKKTRNRSIFSGNNLIRETLRESKLATKENTYVYIIKDKNIVSKNTCCEKLTLFIMISPFIIHQPMFYLYWFCVWSLKFQDQLKRIQTRSSKFAISFFSPIGNNDIYLINLLYILGFLIRNVTFVLELN